MLIILPISVIIGSLSFFVWNIKNKSNIKSQHTSVSELMGYIHDCANIFLKEQYSLIIKIILIVSAIMFTGSFLGHFNHFFGLVIFTGGLWGGVIGYFSLKFSISSVETLVEKIKNNKEEGSRYMMYSGSILVITCVTILLADMGALLFTLNHIFDHNIWGLTQPILNKMGYTETWTPHIARSTEFIHQKFEIISLILMSYTIGASIQAMISRIAGGIFRVSTHLGTENAFEETDINLPEDDIRNPGILADLVGRHVSGVSGSLAGLIQLIAISLAITTYLASYVIEVMPEQYPSSTYTLAHILLGIGLISQCIGVWSLKYWKNNSISIMRKGQFTSFLFNIIGIAALYQTHTISLRLGLAGIIGIIGSHTIFYGIISKTNHAQPRHRSLGSTLITGLEEGLKTSCIPIIGTVTVLTLAYVVGNGIESIASGLYTVSISAIAALGSSFFLRGIACAQPVASTGVSISRMLQDEDTTKLLIEEESLMSRAATGADSSFGLALFLIVTTSIVVIMISLKHWIHKLAGNQGLQLGTTIFSNHPMPNNPKVMIINDIHIFDLADKLGINLVNPQLLAGLALGLTTVIIITYICIRHISILSNYLSSEIKTEFIQNPDIAEGRSLPDYGKNIGYATIYSDKAVVIPFILGCSTICLVSLGFGISGAIGFILGSLLSIFAIHFMIGYAASFLEKARISTDSNSYLRALSNVFLIIPHCIQPVLNTVLILILSFSTLTGIIALKFGHLLIL